MKVSELISDLQRVLENEGDIPMAVHLSEDECYAHEITVAVHTPQYVGVPTRCLIEI